MTLRLTGVCPCCDQPVAMTTVELSADSGQLVQAISTLALVAEDWEAIGLDVQLASQYGSRQPTPHAGYCAYAPRLGARVCA
jgi:hypothetical protein